MKWSEFKQAFAQEWRSYRYLSKASKYLKKARKLLQEDREMSIAYRDLALIYERRSKENKVSK